MKVEASWRIKSHLVGPLVFPYRTVHAANEVGDPVVGMLVPDTRLQAISDAWDGYLVAVDGLGEEAMAWYELAVLLEALTEEDNDEGD